MVHTHKGEEGMTDEEVSEGDSEESNAAIPKVLQLVERLVKDCPRLFSGVANKNPADRGRLGTAKIKLKPNLKVYRYREYQPQNERAKAVKTLLRKFIECEWIEPSDSEWAGPAFILPREEKDKWRLIVEYGELIEQTEHDLYSLPLIDTILQKQARKRIFTVLDLRLPITRCCCTRNPGHVRP